MNYTKQNSNDKTSTNEELSPFSYISITITRQIGTRDDNARFRVVTEYTNASRFSTFVLTVHVPYFISVTCIQTSAQYFFNLN